MKKILVLLPAFLAAILIFTILYFNQNVERIEYSRAYSISVDALFFNRGNALANKNYYIADARGINSPRTYLLQNLEIGDQIIKKANNDTILLIKPTGVEFLFEAMFMVGHPQKDKRL